jgi:TPR repeat protein
MSSYKKLTLPLILLLNFTASLAMDVPDSSPQTTKRKREDNVENRSLEDKGIFNEEEETQRPLKKRQGSPEKQEDNVENRSLEDKGIFNEEEETQRPLKKRQGSPEKQSESSEDSTELRVIEFPDEIQINILQYLEEENLLRTREVCRKFKDLISSFATLCPDYNEKGALIANKNVKRFTQLTEIIRNTDNQNSPEEIAKAHFGLGELYLMGAFKNPNYQKALNYYNESINLEYQYAWVRKGLMYEEGLGGLRDLIAARLHYKKSKCGNREKALIYLAGLFKEGDVFKEEDNFLQDYLKAFELFKKLADQGDVAAQLCLGVMYEDGKGIEQDVKIAIELYQKSAEQGDKVAQWLLGDHYEKGQGVKQDYSLAVHWYQQAANQGEVSAQRALGIMYQEGKGVEQNFSLAIHWHQQAAKQGDTQSQHALEIMYQRALPYIGKLLKRT